MLTAMKKDSFTFRYLVWDDDGNQIADVRAVAIEADDIGFAETAVEDAIMDKYGVVHKDQLQWIEASVFHPDDLLGLDQEVQNIELYRTVKEVWL